ncbi:hypothetical protein CANARDRAFT_6308 [[Candida] arabinofermentans NRRL YB-2248]|uniref:Uncharacterized protein n=1 Tax=[Candida] arabinofermentans NRRL YB-2248 TaxID=983967 RepID=A0A1E4T4Q0_9ASCO|nr:hypothetical protein CANARDRAFT_6308 [[Candida] arabinofermentans NRRL YB-2248]
MNTPNDSSAKSDAMKDEVSSPDTPQPALMEIAQGATPAVSTSTPSGTATGTAAIPASPALDQTSTTSSSVPAINSSHSNEVQTKQHNVIQGSSTNDSYRRSSTSKSSSTPIATESSRHTRTRSGSQGTRGGRFSWVRRLMNNNKPLPSGNATAGNTSLTMKNHYQPKVSNPIVSSTSTATPATTAEPNETTSNISLHPSKSSSKSVRSRTARFATNGPSTEIDQLSYLSTDNASTLDNISTKPILSLSSSEDEEDDSGSFSHLEDNYYTPSMKSTAMTSIAPTAYTESSNNTNGNLIINPGGGTTTSIYSGGNIGANNAPSISLSSITNSSQYGWTNANERTNNIQGGTAGLYQGFLTPRDGAGAGTGVGTLADSSSVITIASSTRNRRRRSIDTNASTSAIPPASIFERISNVPGGSITGSSMKAVNGGVYSGGREQDSVLSSGDYYSIKS